MPEPYPNLLLSVPLSIVSPRHYAQVHDQPFLRTLIYLVLLALVLTVLGLVVSIVGFVSDAKRHAAELAEPLSAIEFESGRASAADDKPAVLWEDVDVITVPAPGGEDEAEQQEHRIRHMLVIVDTSDTSDRLDSWEAAAEFTGCGQPDVYLFFGTEQIEWFEPATNARDTEKYDYTDAEKLAELREKLAEVQGKIEEAGGTMPKLPLEGGIAAFGLPEGSLKLVHDTAHLMVLVDTTGENRAMSKAVDTACREDKALRRRFERPPEFLVLITATTATVKPRYDKEPSTWEFASQGDADPAALADWIATTARSARLAALLGESLKWLMFTAFILFVGALLISVVGLIANRLMHGNLVFGELLTMAVYATTPAATAFLLAAIAIQGSASLWVLVLALAVGAIYEAVGTREATRETDPFGSDPVPPI